MQAASSSNDLLRRLSEADPDGPWNLAVRTSVDGGDILCDAEERPEWVYFPESGAISLVSVMHGARDFATDIVGFEGAIGLVEAAGSGVSFSRFIGQLAGASSRLQARLVRQACRNSAVIRQIVAEQAELQIIDARQAAACIAVHTTVQRLAWWLLSLQDCARGANAIPMNQEQLGLMLAVQRTTVTAVAGQLESAGMITTRRGRITILDRPGLQRHACECYANGKRHRTLVGGREDRALVLA